MSDRHNFDINEKPYEALELLGKGKGGYSYLVKGDEELYVLKQIHHEPCEYYQFGNKIESELKDYETLNQIGIRMPRLIEVDYAQERILKEYIDGKTIYQMIREHIEVEQYKEQVRAMCKLLYPAHLNIDYYPTNFVVNDGLLFYIDYECNDYMEEWNFENWGEKEWK